MKRRIIIIIIGFILGYAVKEIILVLN